MKKQMSQITEKAKERPEIKRFGSLLPNDKSTKLQKSKSDQWSLSIDSQRIHGRNKLLKHIPQGQTFRSVGYDWNLGLILDWILEKNYAKSTIIIGYNLSGKDEDEARLAQMV